MNIQEKLCYSTLLLSIVAIVFWWRLGIITLMLFAVASVVKMLTTHQHRKAPLPKLFFLLPLYWLVYVISACYSSNHTEGWDTVVTKLFFLILPVLFLLDDTSYLTRRRIGALFYMLIAAIVLRFFICLGMQTVDILHGIPFNTADGWNEDPLGLHHSYLALYISVAMTFLYAEAVSNKGRHSVKWWIVSGAAALVLLAYVAISRTRSGMVALALLFIAGLVHLFFIRKRRKLALIICASGLAACVAAYLADPGLNGVFGRFYALIYCRNLGITQDRTIILRCASELAVQRPIFGYGSGDYMEALLQNYAQHDFQMGLDYHYGSHNQYMETLLECGIIGLTAMLAMLVAPLIQACRRGSRSLFVALAVMSVMAVIFFESMLNRQMGVQFVALLYCLLILRLEPEAQLKNTDTR